MTVNRHGRQAMHMGETMRFGLLLASLLAVTTSPIALAAPTAASMSALPTRPDDPAAKIVKGKGDGRADDTAAIQQALDTARDKTGHGLVFLPSGRYRITRTLIVPIGVRVFGTGPTRPVIVLAPNTPGVQQGVSTKIVFTGGDQYNGGDVPVPVPGVVPAGKVKVPDLAT